MWDEPLDPSKIHWPRSHRERYQKAAAAAGLSLNQYVIRYMAKQHELGGPRGQALDDGAPQLTLHDSDGDSQQLAS